MVGKLWRSIFGIFTFLSTIYGDTSVPLKNPKNDVLLLSESATLNNKNPTQSPSRSKKIKILMLLWRDETEAEQGFLQELKNLGYEVTLTTFNADYNLRGLKQALLEKDEQNVYNPNDYDYIYTFGTLVSLIAIEWLHKRNSTTPIVFNVVSDPMRSGLVLDYAGHNGGNLSGVCTSPSVEKQLENARAICTIKYLFTLINPTEQNCLNTFEALEIFSKAKNITIVRIDITNENDIINKLKQIEKEKEKEKILTDMAIYIPSSSFFTKNIKSIFDYLRSIKMPIIAEQRDMIEMGGLIGLTASYDSAGKEAAQIIKLNRTDGIQMENIPVRFPKFFCFINKDTAERLSLSIDDQKLKVQWLEPQIQQLNDIGTAAKQQENDKLPSNSFDIIKSLIKRVKEIDPSIYRRESDKHQLNPFQVIKLSIYQLILLRELMSA
ncbi:MAG: ABC transporter substrate-binding protein [Puniceicoccales bacterium]|jgi:ABC-type uncharacterized transport system substrate-binding protein|nr:ABC transporter substrate-binding protein [Puniceicoccales bacterium]